MIIARMHGSDLVYWDEFAHWGQMTKELFRLNAFYTIDQTTLLFHNDYPPIIPLWEALCCKVAGKWSGQFMYASLWLLQLSVFLPFIERTGKKLGGRALDASSIIVCVLLFSLVLVPCFDGGGASFWLSIYIDTILGLLFGLGVYLAMQKKKSGSSWVAIGILSCFLVLVKQSSIFFVGCILIVTAAATIFASPREQRKRNFRSLALVLIVCMASYISWKYVLSISTLDAVHGQFSAPLKEMLTLPQILTGADATYRPEVVNLFMEALASRIIVPYLWLPVTYIGATAFLMLATSLCCLKFKVGKAQSICLVSSQAGISALYAAFMLIMYLFSFRQTDGLSLVCYERYMNTVLVGLYTGTFMLCVQYMSTSGIQANRIVNIFVLAFCLILMTSPAAMDQIRTEKNASAKEFSKDGELLEQSLPEESSVFIINQGENPFETLEIAYYADGIKVSREVEEYYSIDSLSWEISPDKFVDLLRDEDFLYVKNVDQKFIDMYRDIFSLPLENDTVYAVDNIQSEAIALSPVAHAKN